MTNQGAWTNQVVSLIILNAAATGFSGMFVYSPSPGAGNLVASVAAANGTDPYGNAYIAGVASYAGSQVSLLESGTLQLQFTAGQISGGFPSELFPNAAGSVVLSSGGDSALDATSQLELQSADAGGGTSQAVLTAQTVTINQNLVVNGTLTVGGSADTGGPIGTGFFNTQGLASGAYGGVHQHTLPNFPTATHTHPL